MLVYSKLYSIIIIITVIIIVVIIIIIIIIIIINNTADADIFENLMPNEETEIPTVEKSKWTVTCWTWYHVLWAVKGLDTGALPFSSLFKASTQVQAFSKPWIKLQNSTTFKYFKAPGNPVSSFGLLSTTMAHLLALACCPRQWQ